MVIAYGLLFTLALLGKLAVGFLVPNFNNTDKFKGLHLRDCLVTGFSMVRVYVLYCYYVFANIIYSLHVVSLLFT